MNIVFIGCVEFSWHLLEHLLTHVVNDHIRVTGIVTKSASAFNTDFASLQPLAVDHSIPYILSDHQDPETIEQWIAEKQPDVIYCFGWSHLLKKTLIDIPPLGVIGYHPTELPHNRGRHPIIWTLVLGLKRTASTFFFMDESADNGDILHQCPLEVNDEDDAHSIYQKLIVVAKNQVEQFTEQLAIGSYERRPQDIENANIWRKRTKKDGEIDWRMAAITIHNLVRGLSRPYPGAHFTFRGKEYKVWKTAVVNEEIEEYDHWEPGKIIKSSPEGILIKCGIGMILLLEHECDPIPEVGIYL